MNDASRLFWRSLAFNAAFYGWTGLLAVAGLPLLVISRRLSIKWGRLWASGALWLAWRICGLTHEIRGLQYITETPVIYASKHQSAWDTIIFWMVFRAPVYVIKKELLWLPLFGLYLFRQGLIAIDRSKGAAAIKQLIRKTKYALHEQRPVVIYPEGTRTVPGAAASYQPGIAAVYSQIKCTVIPVALNSGLYWGRNAFIKRPGKIIIEFLPPIEPGLPSKEFLARLQTTIESATARLIDEAGGLQDHRNLLYFSKAGT